MAKKKAASKAPTKNELYASIAEKTGLSKKDVGAVLDALGEELTKAVKEAGQFTLHGLLKVVVQHREATKKRQVRNPATGEMVWAAPKPARKVVKVRPLKTLKEMV
jgi:nucleoid DNA-binding protein